MSSWLDCWQDCLVATGGVRWWRMVRACAIKTELQEERNEAVIPLTNLHVVTH